MIHRIRPALTTLLLSACMASVHGAIISNGSDGAFVAVAGSNVIDLTSPGREDGILNFTTITIPANATVSFKRNALNTPVFMAAMGNIEILGIVNISASANMAGPGGGEGGSAGVGDANCSAPECHAATGGGGVLGGNAGANAAAGGIKSTPGFAGSGGGMATPGLAADPARFSRSAPATGALAQLPAPLVGGSGGGGGGGWMFFGVELGGGAGGDGGGAIQFSSLADILFGGTLLADGANGGFAFTNSGGTGGPGGGGSGGNIQMVADRITVQNSAVVHATGGWGGCLGTEPCDRDRAAFSKLNSGGSGFFDLTARSVTLSDEADIQALTAVHVVPLPSSLLLLAPALLAFGAARKRGVCRPATRRRT